MNRFFTAFLSSVRYYCIHSPKPTNYIKIYQIQKYEEEIEYIKYLGKEIIDYYLRVRNFAKVCEKLLPNLSKFSHEEEHLVSGRYLYYCIRAVVLQGEAHQVSAKEVQGDQLYMAVCFEYIVKRDLSSVQV